MEMEEPVACEECGKWVELSDAFFPEEYDDEKGCNTHGICRECYEKNYSDE